MLAVQFEELQQQDAQILRRVNFSPLYFWMQLDMVVRRIHLTNQGKISTDLQERDNKANDAVTAQATRKDLVETSLHEEGLDDHDQRLCRSHTDVLEQVLNRRTCRYAARLIDRDIDGKVAVRGAELDDYEYSLSVRV